MKILFIHQNFPGQFKFLAPELVARGHDVFATIINPEAPEIWQGVRLVKYQVERGNSSALHPWLKDFESKTIRGEACFKACLVLKSQGFVPDVVIAHPGWGESLFVKEVWPQTKLGIYCEFFYHPSGADTGFDPEFKSLDQGDSCRVILKNINNLLHAKVADAGISPTYWQASTYPADLKKKITVIHDGINTQEVRPAEAVLKIRAQDQDIQITRNDKVVTYVSRSLEPYRGFHSFMRAIPKMLEAEPKLRVIIVGAEGVSYGAKPDPEKFGKSSWKSIFFEELKSNVNKENIDRIIFLGKVSYTDYLAILRISSVHVYLTYPFVLSWSLLEAMSVGCCVVASNTAPLKEVIDDDKTGCLVDFFDYSAIGSKVIELLNNPDKRAKLSRNARKFVIENFDLKTVCLPKQIQWVESLAGSTVN